MSELRTNRIVPRDGLTSGTHNGGGIIQVRLAVHTEYVKFNTSSFSAGTMAGGGAGNYQITITPTRADSKILVSFNCSYDNNVGNQRMQLTIYRGTSTNLGGDQGFCQIWNPDQRIQGVATAQYLDSPATTSAVTYHVYGKVTTGDGYLGVYSDHKWMHAMEVSG